MAALGAAPCGLLGPGKEPREQWVRREIQFPFELVTRLIAICTERHRPCGLKPVCWPQYSSENLAIHCRSALCCQGHLPDLGLGEQCVMALQTFKTWHVQPMGSAGHSLGQLFKNC